MYCFNILNGLTVYLEVGCHDISLKKTAACLEFYSVDLKGSMQETEKQQIAMTLLTKKPLDSEHSSPV